MMKVHMFGRLTVACRDTPLVIETRKVQELFCYLLLHRQRPHARETLASVFWNNTPTAQSRANLRKTLWQLQCALGVQLSNTLILADTDWIQISPDGVLWLDTGELELCFTQVRGSCGEELSDDDAELVTRAVALYHGDLLAGWYQDWCLFERERLQHIYLALLDKLMGYCESRHAYERGLAYGAEILQYDHLREQTYRRLMRLHARAGDRASALRQYERCVAMLANELDIGPSAPTVELYERIHDDRPLDDLGPTLTSDPAMDRRLDEMLAHLRQMQSMVAVIGQTIGEEIQKIEGLVRKRSC